MFVGSLYVALLLMAGKATGMGYYEGGTVFWEVLDPVSRPREVTVQFELHFDTSTSPDAHQQCTKNDIGQKLYTGGLYHVGSSPDVFADYYCAQLDEKHHSATGTYNLTYTMKPNELTAEISYLECCWVDRIRNNGQTVGNGRGWNLVSTINLNHKDGVSINSPPQSKSFPEYSIMSGCTYTIKIANDDANNDVVKCRWTKGNKDECNPNAMDICGVPYFDIARNKAVAILDKENCELKFGEAEAIPPGTYAFMVMLEDFAPNKLKKPMSKTSLHFLMNVFEFEGECRQPQLHIPRMCFAHVLGEEFRLRIVATATAPNYRITSIAVQGSSIYTPSKVSGSDVDYEAMFTFMPTIKKTYTFCVLAYEEERFISSQACFTVRVRDTEPQALRVDKTNSIPASGDQEATGKIDKWAIQFNRRIRKGVFGPAYVTLRDSNNDVVWRVDATGPDVEIVDDEILSFPNAIPVATLETEEFFISLDEGVVQSGDEKCSVKSKPSEWSFFIKGAPAFKVHKPDCSVSSMVLFIPKPLVDLGEHGPEMMHLRDPKCRGTNFNDTHYYLWTSYGTCGTTFKHSGTDYTYSNTIYIPDEPYTPPGTEVTRVSHREISFSCNIPAKTIKTITFRANPGQIRHEEYSGRVDFLDNLPETSLRLFNANYNQPYKEVIAPFSSRLYFEGKATCRGNRQCDAFFQSCWAGTSDNPYDWPRHDLIKGGCIKDSSLTTHETGASNKVRFSVDTFAFLGWRLKHTVFVHCNVFVCSSSDTNSICKRGCLGSRSLPEDDKVSLREFMSVVSSPGLVWQK